MSIVFFVQTLLWFLLIMSASVGVGGLMLKILKAENPEFAWDQLGTRLAVGLGTIGYISYTLALLGKFQRETIIVLTVLGSLVGLSYCLKLVINGILWTKTYLRKKTYDWISIATLLLGLVVAVSLYLSAMQPPHATDELHYHFPEAKNIVTTGKVNWDFDGHYFYGNIPKLMEVIFAYGMIVGEYPLAHALNLAVSLSFIFIVLGVVKRHFGLKSAALAILLILLFEDYTWNATVGFVDAATVSMEIGSLLYIVEWYVGRQRKFLIWAGCLIGLALGMKYSPMATGLFSVLVVMAGALKKSIKNLSIYGLMVLTFGGVWYIKNLALYLNPFYPMYFGHVGVPNETYLGLMAAIQQFQPKTIQTFVHLIDHYRRYTEITVYASLFLAPLALLVKRERVFIKLLTAYYLLYIPYWFYSTHQIRFLMPAIVVASILTAVIVAQYLNKKTILYLVGLTIIVGLIWPNWAITVWHRYWNTKLHLVERQYALGNISETEYLSREFGCQYKVVEYLKRNKIEGKILDNWSVWHDPSVSYFSTQNKFVVWTRPPGATQTASELAKEQGIKYLYLKTSTRRRYLDDPDLTVEKTKLPKTNTEQALLKNSLLIYENGECQLYQLN